jgi:hypothetical protein
MSPHLRRALGLGAVVLLALMSFAAHEAFAQAGSPQEFLTAIYKNYQGKDAPGTDLSAPDDVNRYFAPDLAAAIIKDSEEAEKSGDAPTLDGDPFVDAQDWDIKNLRIDAKPAGGNAAGATVTFTNFGEKQAVRIDLVKTAAGWRVREIKAPSGSLRELMGLK